jgi:hypothetical protein
MLIRAAMTMEFAASRGERTPPLPGFPFRDTAMACPGAPGVRVGAAEDGASDAGIVSA